MEPITIIVTAIALGAAAGLKQTTENAVKDVYAELKNYIKEKYSTVSIELIEKEPKSKFRQKVVKEDLAKTDANKDENLLRYAQAVLDDIHKHDPETADEIGINLEDIKGASLKIEDIIATGIGVNIKHGELKGDIEIKNVRAGNRGNSLPNLPRQ